MSPWQLTLVVLVSVACGALIPALLIVAHSLYKSAKDVSKATLDLQPSIAHVRVISERIETLTKGLEGGEKTIKDVLSVVGDLSRGLERNVAMTSVATTVMTAAGSAAAAFVKTMREPDETPATNSHNKKYDNINNDPETMDHAQGESYG